LLAKVRETEVRVASLLLILLFPLGQEAEVCGGKELGHAGFGFGLFQFSRVILFSWLQLHMSWCRSHLRRRWSHQAWLGLVLRFSEICAETGWAKRMQSTAWVLWPRWGRGFFLLWLRFVQLP